VAAAEGACARPHLSIAHLCAVLRLSLLRTVIVACVRAAAARVSGVCCSQAAAGCLAGCCCGGGDLVVMVVNILQGHLAAWCACDTAGFAALLGGGAV
jgi:hypothetical protein